MKKVSAILMAALAFAACSTDDNYNLDYFTQKYKQSETPEPTPDPTPEPTPESDTLYVAIAYNATTASLTGDVDKITVSQTGADVTLTSTSEKYLQVTLSGTATDGSLLVNSQNAWELVLNGLQLTNADGPAINNQCSKWFYVTLADGTENTLSDKSDYTEQSFDQKGTLFSEGQIRFQGTGKLTVNGNVKNGIACDDYIVIDNGTINVNTSEDGSNGIKANDGFTMNGGTLTIDVKSDGGRGIRSESFTTISGGTLTITTSGDCEMETVDGVQDASSAAGIKCDSLFTMTDGTLTIKSTGDGGKGINCSQNVEFKGGTLTITTTGSNEEAKPKGIKSDTGIIVSGGSLSVNVKKSWACDNGTDSDTPADHLTVEGTPATKTITQKAVTIIY